MQTIEMVRLIADEGKALSNGKVLATCVDCCPASEADNWSEIDMPVGMKFNLDSTEFETPSEESPTSEEASVEAVSTVDGES